MKRPSQMTFVLSCLPHHNLVQQGKLSKGSFCNSSRAAARTAERLQLLTAMRCSGCVATAPEQCRSGLALLQAALPCKTRLCRGMLSATRTHADVALSMH